VQHAIADDSSDIGCDEQWPHDPFAGTIRDNLPEPGRTRAVRHSTNIMVSMGVFVLRTRDPRPDAPDWPGRRLLAAVDAVAWPPMWLLLIRQGTTLVLGKESFATARFLGLAYLAQR
jgi:hypothetical protein